MRNLVVFVLVANVSFSQMIYGELKDEGRKLLTKYEFVQKGRKSGYVNVNLAVDREGNVTSAKTVKSTFTSTVTDMKVRQSLMKLKFEKGTHFPKFHQVVVRVTLVEDL